MIKVKVKLFATLREGRSKEMMLSFSESTSPAMILDGLKIKKEDVAILMINGMNGPFDKELKDGDTLSIFPPVGGG